MENQKPEGTPEESNSVAKDADTEKPLSDTELENAVGGRKPGDIKFMEVKMNDVIITGVQSNQK
jgi:hypothetical protein